MDQKNNSLADKKPRRKVLIVDDHRNQIEGIEYGLKQNGFDVLYTNDGNKGLAIIKSSPPDLVLLDLGMPGRSGFLILEQLRFEDIYSGPVVIVTGIDGQRHHDYSLTLGAAAIFKKPYIVEELVAKIRELVAA
ncbi:MAG: response regulator transcription factor [Pirellulaceae bacterium]|jgi:DNA-binding response OmpR family regulator|nr:response regulator transcription factor [Pirellulaceae bacterium]